MNSISCLGGKRHPNFKDLTGRTFGRLFVLTECVTSVGCGVYYLCKCDCGRIKIISGNKLSSGNTISCGCYAREITSKVRTTHGLTDTRTYRIWAGMVDRCNNPGATSYHNYGGRGIKVCGRWRNSFEAFFEDMGECPPGSSIDRVDPCGDYTSFNCRWATRIEQNRNKRNNRCLLLGTRKDALSSICEFFNISYKATWVYLDRNGESSLFSYIMDRYSGDFSSQLSKWNDGPIIDGRVL